MTFVVPMFKIISWGKFVNIDTFPQTTWKTVSATLKTARNRRSKYIPKKCFSPSVLCYSDLVK